MQVGLVTLGEFKRTAAAATQSGHFAIGAQETEHGFIVIARNLSTGSRFTVRHAAKKLPRTWRLDRLCSWLKECGVQHIEVRHMSAEPSNI
ncbi:MULTISPECIES: hypothetical protein [Vibrio]|uniref:hypothetical protein n=1 Tax=Vibrio TaxID=662 RepID=UPI0013DF2386|nr:MULTISPECIES: hypothetical protein [Vibrio]MBS9976476.1 hypothetical protein [Vibrio alginolyticus]MBT0022552.1 hypothetical protein [Vibrio alginolyticus]NNN58893.1 hypothetical protein [Vibrio sp. 1-2 (7-a)]QOV28554.1 hypothetical protein INT50_00405 [Vibrio diabolicus]